MLNTLDNSKHFALNRFLTVHPSNIEQKITYIHLIFRPFILYCETHVQSAGVDFQPATRPRPGLTAGPAKNTRNTTLRWGETVPMCPVLST